MRNFFAGLFLGALLTSVASDSALRGVPASAPANAAQPGVTGIGGVFFLSENPRQLTAWYREHLGLPSKYGGTTVLEWRELDRPDVVAHTVWGPFAKTTKYFRKEGVQWMVNFRVTQLDALLATLRQKGIRVEDKIESDDYGRFAWIYDPEGNRVELWEPTPIPPPKAPAPAPAKEKP